MRALPLLLPLLLLPLAAFAAPAEAPPGAKAAPAVDAGPAPAGAGPVVFAAGETGLPAEPSTTLALPAAGEGYALGVWPARPFQGALLLVDVAGPDVRAVRGTFAGRKLRFHRFDAGTLRGVGPVPDDATPGEATLALEIDLGAGKAKRTVKREVPLGVAAVAFDEDTLRVDPKFTKLSAEARARIADDRKALNAMWRKGSPDAPRFRRNFASPRDDRTTAPYGTRRTFNGTVKGVHAGWDIDGDVGDEIRCVNDGVVRMARDLYYSGGTLFVDHGAGIYSAYFHLSGFAVKEGEKVKRGQLCGQVGKSGRVTGPHLHFGAKVGGVYLHPETLLRADFERPLVRFPDGAVPAPGPAEAAAPGEVRPAGPAAEGAAAVPAKATK